MSDGDIHEATAEGNEDKLSRYDSLDVESGNVLRRHGSDLKQVGLFTRCELRILYG